MGKRKNYDLELSFFESLHRRMPKDQRVVGMLAQIYTKTGQIDLGLKMDRKLVRLRPNDPISHYNLACSLALKDRRADALRVLRTAISLGYTDFDWMQHDPDLNSLRGHPAYQELLREVLN